MLYLKIKKINAAFYRMGRSKYCNQIMYDTKIVCKYLNNWIKISYDPIHTLWYERKAINQNFYDVVYSLF